MQVPKINGTGGLPQIESKNLSLVEDQMNHEALACKKIGSYATQFEDPQLKQHAQTLGQRHRSNFEKLNQYLNGHQ